jgi:hypothetical protein
MLKYIAISSTLLFFASCRGKKDASYNTDALDCVTSLIESYQKNDTKQSIKILKKYKDNFKFAGDLEEKISDKQEINTAEDLATKGKLTQAKAILDKRLVERGYSEELNNSQNIVSLAINLDRFNKERDQLPIIDASREFAKLQIQGKQYFETNPHYQKWLQKNSTELAQKAVSDKKMILRSLKFTADYVALYKPELLEIILLESASQENTTLIPGLNDRLSKNISTAINNKGLEKINSDLYDQTRPITTPASMMDSYKKIVYIAKSGKTALTLASLQELQDLGSLPQVLRKKILKTLFLAKGWNNTSLINRDFMDLSVLLETLYKANQ